MLYSVLLDTRTGGKTENIQTTFGYIHLETLENTAYKTEIDIKKSYNIVS